MADAREFGCQVTNETPDLVSGLELFQHRGLVDDHGGFGHRPQVGNRDCGNSAQHNNYAADK